MTNEEAIRRLNTLLTNLNHVPTSESILMTKHAIRVGICALHLQAERRWIPVNEKLPEEEQAVFVTYYVVNNRNRRYVMESYLMPGGKWFDPYRTFRVHSAFIRIIAWMPLPDPYDGVLPIN